MRILTTGDYIFWKKRNEFLQFITFWKYSNVVVFAYQLFTIKSYDEISISVFEKYFLVEKKEIKQYIEKLINDEKTKNMIKVPEKEFKKLELQREQANCMEKLNKPENDKKKGMRNIKRQLKKINRYIERNEEIKKEINLKYSSILENFKNIFEEEITC